jgi:hypothetical protein
MGMDIFLCCPAVLNCFKVLPAISVIIILELPAALQKINVQYIFAGLG